MDPEASGKNHGPKPSNAQWMILPHTLPHSRLEKWACNSKWCPWLYASSASSASSASTQNSPVRLQRTHLDSRSPALVFYPQAMACELHSCERCINVQDLSWVLVNANSPKYWVVLRLMLAWKRKILKLSRRRCPHTTLHMSCRRASSVATTWSSCTVRFSPTIFDWLICRVKFISGIGFFFYA